MTVNKMRKLLAEKNIKKIEKELANLDGEQSASFLRPIEDVRETYMIRNKEHRRKQLLAELEKNKKILEKDEEDSVQEDQ